MTTTQYVSPVDSGVRVTLRINGLTDDEQGVTVCLTPSVVFEFLLNLVYHPLCTSELRKNRHPPFGTTILRSVP